MPATELHHITPDLTLWQAYEPAVKCDLTSCALRTPAGLVLVDPIPLSDEALDELASLAKPVAVVATNGNHARAAEFYRKRFEVPVLCSGGAQPELEVTVDLTLTDGQEFAGGLRAVEIPGAGPGEIAIIGTKVICTGDALIHLDPHGFALLPAKYCTDAKLLPASLRKLLQYEFQVLTFAHGWPLVQRARQRLELLLQ